VTSACPSPHKHRHASRGAALAAIDSLQRANPDLVSPDLLPYLCGCGSWHVGHSQDSLQTRIRRAIGGGRPRRPR
jgi:hypothetical protein